jgi:hypothetical protein
MEQTMAVAGRAKAIGAPRNPDVLERISRALTLAVFITAMIGCVIAPIIALSWSHKPFPGFIINQTLVVSDTSGQGWSSRENGITFGDRVVRVGGVEVRNSREYQAVISQFKVGDVISFFMRRPDGSARLYPDVLLTDFAPRDMLRLFWMPYFLGLAYLGIGVWIYRARGMTRPGRSLAFFCFCTAIATGLYFDVFTTHAATLVWSAALAGVGGALISLALRFPQELGVVSRRPWLLMVPYLVSILLGIWNAAALLNPQDPYAFLEARNAVYRYAAIAAIFFMGMIIFRAFTGSSTVRVQARIVLLCSLIAFIPIMIWILAPVFGGNLKFEPAIFMPPLVIFPIGVGIAIFRYRLLEMDAIVNRTIMWGILTAILAGAMSASVTLFQKFFVAITGEKSDLAVVMTTLILISLFTPIKSRMQTFLDKRLKETPDSTRALRTYGEEVRAYVQMNDAQEMTQKLLDEAAKALNAESGAVRLVSDGHLRTVCTFGTWRGDALLAAPLESDGMRFGLLLLGPRQDQRAYTRTEFEALQTVAAIVSRALHHTTLHELIDGDRRAVLPA